MALAASFRLLRFRSYCGVNKKRSPPKGTPILAIPLTILGEASFDQLGRWWPPHRVVILAKCGLGHAQVIFCADYSCDKAANVRCDLHRTKPFGLVRRDCRPQPHTRCGSRR